MSVSREWCFLTTWCLVANYYIFYSFVSPPSVVVVSFLFFFSLPRCYVWFFFFLSRSYSIRFGYNNIFNIIIIITVYRLQILISMSSARYVHNRFTFHFVLCLDQTSWKVSKTKCIYYLYFHIYLFLLFAFMVIVI